MSTKWAKANPDKVRELNLESKRRQRAREYGMNEEEYARLNAELGGRCMICQEFNVRGRRLGIDHDHATGKSRGLLCYHCNMALGSMKDDPHRLRIAAEYLLFWTQKHSE